MPLRVATKRRVKRRQQRLVSKNAKRNARSVHKLRKTAKKVMRGGLFGRFEWKKDFDVLDYVSQRGRIRNNVFTLSVTKNILSGYDITLIFDINVFPEFNPNVFTDYAGVNLKTGDFEYHPDHNREEGIVTVIMKLIESIGGKMNEEASNSTRRSVWVRSSVPVYTITRLDNLLPDKFAAIKAQWHRDRAIKGGIKDSRLDTFLEQQEQQQQQEEEDADKKMLQDMNKGKVTRKCEIKMTLETDKSKKDDTHDVLVFNEFTVISKKQITTNNLLIRDQTFDVYEWENRKPDEVYKKIATFKPSFTLETLKGALDALGTEFYTITKQIKSDFKHITSAKKNMTTDADVLSVPEQTKKSDNIIITFDNGDTFLGEYERKQMTTSSAFLVLFKDGTYTWNDKTQYTGKSFTRNLDSFRQTVQVLGFNKKTEFDSIVTRPSHNQESAR
jgi:hypothetical protein